jgi:hypothetical protein
VRRQQSANRVQLLKFLPRADEFVIFPCESSLGLRVRKLGEQQTHLLAVVNRPWGFLLDNDLETRTQEEKRQAFLRSKGLEQEEVSFASGIEVDHVFQRRDWNPGDTEGNRHYPQAFFGLVPYGSGRDRKTRAAERKEISDACGQSRACRSL